MAKLGRLPPTHHMPKKIRLRPGSQLLLFLVCFTIGVWVLRGLTLLSFLPGLVLWLLILACLGVFVFNSLQSMR
ncbi:MAG: hypothetical protein AAFN12_06615 [Cyanobacteria bacterium J06560_2]